MSTVGFQFVDKQVDNEEDDNVDEHDYLLNSDELENVEIELIDGNKPNSNWLVLEKSYVCHVNDKSCDSDIVYWECKRRRHDKCPFKCATQLDERGRHQLIYMYSLETHNWLYGGYGFSGCPGYPKELGEAGHRKGKGLSLVPNSHAPH